MVQYYGFKNSETLLLSAALKSDYGLEIMSGWFPNGILGSRPVLVNFAYFDTTSPSMKAQITKKNLTNQLFEISRKESKSVL